ncbi:AAA family ATPase [Caulobacter sp. AP07]|uniref:AAA family ATPase n=1 Tax=Caulobacter sp. AP07 TaxID=1144304 RepID=UPI000559293D|nr:AAA family ATPase [Caulobacter sp. AP07]
MRQLERPDAAPPILRSKEATGSRRRLQTYWRLEPLRRAQTSPPSLGFAADDGRLVAALSSMSGGRCAFCEARDTLFVHRFRPIGNALPVGRSKTPHLYYLWLADAWQNLLPICGTCIPTEPQFPVGGKRARLPSISQVDAYVDRADGRWNTHPPGDEDPLLLDPVQVRNFEQHLAPKLDGELIASSSKAEHTIAVFDLNRAERRHQRYQAYQKRLQALGAFLAQAEREPEEERTVQASLFDFADMEFGGTWFLLLRRIALRIAKLLEVRWSTSRANIFRFFLRLAAQERAAAGFNTALEAVALEDTSVRARQWSLGAVYSVRAPITRVEIQNFKAIEHLELNLSTGEIRPEEGASFVTPSLVILGENATGKSSILEAMALSLTTPAARGALDLTWPDFILDPSQLGLEQGHDDRRATVSIRLATGQSVKLTINDNGPSVSSELGNHQVPVFAYGAFRRYSRRALRPAAHKHVRNLFDASPLSNPEPWLKSLSKEAFDMVVRSLRDLLSIEGDFDVIERKRGVKHLRVVTSVTEPDGVIRYSKTPLHAVSSGYRSMLAMLCDIMRGLLDERVYEGFENFQTAQGVVLIDEIEAHLHPRWKVQVMTSLRTALPRMTFVVTTHDPLCLRGMGEGEVEVLQRVATVDSGHESQLPILVERMENLPNVADLRVEQLLTSDFFQLLSSDDAAADRRLAHIGDLIAARRRDALSPADGKILDDFEQDIASALPVGSSEVHRMVQEAVATYLEQRHEASSQTLHRLRDKAKADILAALQAL